MKTVYLVSFKGLNISPFVFETAKLAEKSVKLSYSRTNCMIEFIPCSVNKSQIVIDNELTGYIERLEILNYIEHL